MHFRSGVVTLVSIARYALLLWCGHSGGANCALCTVALVAVSLCLSLRVYVWVYV